ncbi:MAG: hypothetical protein FWD56_03945, partial [Bacteroidales bacterium]|nr:hypothetical protein [Bacteroidales bacterium]
MKQNTHILLTLTPELRLAQALKQAGVNDPATINKLVISGTLADDDFWYMHENMVETLQKLDIGNVIIRENGIGFPGFREFSALNSVILPDSLIWIG